MDAIVRPEVSDVRGLGRELHEQPAVHVHGALGPAGRARGVAEQDRMLALDRRRPPDARSIGDEIVVPDVAALLPRHVHTEPAEDDDVPERRRLGGGPVGGLLRRRRGARAAETRRR